MTGTVGIPPALTVYAITIKDEGLFSLHINKTINDFITGEPSTSLLTIKDNKSESIEKAFGHAIDAVITEYFLKKMDAAVL